MATPTQDLLYGVASQTLTLDAPEGQASSITSVKVFAFDVDDDGTEESALTGTTSIDSVSTTVWDDSGAGTSNTKEIALTSATGVTAGKYYQVARSNGWSEIVECVKASTGLCVTRHPLHNEYTSGDTFKGVRLSATVSDSWAADENNISANSSPNPSYRVRWVYVVGGVTYVKDTYCDLVRYAGDHTVLPGDVESLLPGWLDRLPLDHRIDRGKRLIAEAYKQVRLDLHQSDRADELVANAEIMDELVKHKVIQLCEWQRVLAGQDDDRRFLLSKQLYDERFGSLVRTVDRVPTRSPDGASAVLTATQITKR